MFNVLLDNKVVANLERKGPTSFRLTYTKEGLADTRPLSKSLPKCEGKALTSNLIKPWLHGFLPEYINQRRELRGMIHMSDDPYIIDHHLYTNFLNTALDLAGATRFVEEGKTTTPYAGYTTSPEDFTEKLAIGYEAKDIAYRNLNSYLAGCVAKIALTKVGNDFAKPMGGMASTHVLKLGTGGLPGNAINEAVCLDLAKRIGLCATDFSIHSAKGRYNETVWSLLEPRFDRSENGRIHTETFCQALSVEPHDKYSVDTPRVLTLLETKGDKVEFTKRMAYFYILNASDMHGSNWTLIYDEDGKTNLSPIYDLWSAYPYLRYNQLMRQAMHIGNEDRAFCLVPDDIRSFANSLELEKDAVLDIFKNIAIDVVSNIDTSLDYVANTYPETEQVIEGLQTAMKPQILSSAKRLYSLIDDNQKARKYDNATHRA